MNLYYREKKENVEDDNSENEGVEIQYWRKHNALHAWMEELYISKGGTEHFNCVEVILNKEDLIKLGTDIMNNNLVPTSGFFFGDTNYNPLENAKEDLSAVGEALLQISLGKEIYYNSWW